MVALDRRTKHKKIRTREQSLIQITKIVLGEEVKVTEAEAEEEKSEEQIKKEIKIALKELEVKPGIPNGQLIILQMTQQ